MCEHIKTNGFLKRWKKKWNVSVPADKSILKKAVNSLILLLQENRALNARHMSFALKRFTARAKQLRSSSGNCHIVFIATRRTLISVVNSLTFDHSPCCRLCCALKYNNSTHTVSVDNCEIKMSLMKESDKCNELAEC